MQHRSLRTAHNCDNRGLARRALGGFGPMTHACASTDTRNPPWPGNPNKSLRRRGQARQPQGPGLRGLHLLRCLGFKASKGQKRDFVRFRVQGLKSRTSLVVACGPMWPRPSDRPNAVRTPCACPEAKEPASTLRDLLQQRLGLCLAPGEPLQG